MIDGPTLVERARAAGFDAAGLCDADLQEGDRVALARWHKAGYHAGMSSISRTLDLRLGGAQALLPTARSVLVVLQSYNQPDLATGGPVAIARYALGKDYHKVIRTKLARLMSAVAADLLPPDYRITVDSTPLLERAYARAAGLGWIGHNAMLVSPSLGSFTLIGTVLLAADLERSHADTDSSDLGCGDCSACADACPNGAIVAPGVVDTRRCTSYWTIEHRGPFPSDIPCISPWIFGCDRCQEICPFNSTALPATESRLCARPHLLGHQPIDLLALSDADLETMVAGTPMRRSGVTGLRRNLVELTRW